MTDHEIGYEALRRLTPAAKLAVMRTIIRQAYVLKAAGIRAMHPELPESAVCSRTREFVGRGRS